MNNMETVKSANQRYSHTTSQTSTKRKPSHMKDLEIRNIEETPNVTKVEKNYDSNKIYSGIPRDMNSEKAEKLIKKYASPLPSNVNQNETAFSIMKNSAPREVDLSRNVSEQSTPGRSRLKNVLIGGENENSETNSIQGFKEKVVTMPSYANSGQRSPTQTQKVGDIYKGDFGHNNYHNFNSNPITGSQRNSTHSDRNLNKPQVPATTINVRRVNQSPNTFENPKKFENYQ